MENRWKMPEGFTKEEAKLEVSRCLSCKNPLCQKGCPTSMQIRDFILKIKEDKLEDAAKIIAENSSLPYICSIVCPHENQCIGHCVLGIKGRGVNVGALERYVVENVQLMPQVLEQSSKKVAIIGAGPAGIACAKELAIRGAKVTIFEATSQIGGVMMYGIPNYRLDVSRMTRMEEELKSLNIEIILNTRLKEKEILTMKKNYDAVFIAVGLTKVKKLGIPGENMDGVYDALDFLRDVNAATKQKRIPLPKLEGKTIVVGAGNVAMDAARSAVRLGSKVMIAYRRSIEEAPATKHELLDAQNEGVEFSFLTNPVEVLGDMKVTGLRCEVMALGQPDASGRRRPIGTGTFIEMPCNQVISAIGQAPEDIFDGQVLKTDHLYLACDDLKTNVEGIYAGGDIVLGAKTVVEAMVCGRKVAKMILEEA